MCSNFGGFRCRPPLLVLGKFEIFLGMPKVFFISCFGYGRKVSTDALDCLMQR